MLVRYSTHHNSGGDRGKNLLSNSWSLRPHYKFEKLIPIPYPRLVSLDGMSKQNSLFISGTSPKLYSEYTDVSSVRKVALN